MLSNSGRNNCIDSISLDDMLSSLPSPEDMRTIRTMSPRESKAMNQEILRNLESLVEPYKLWRMKNSPLNYNQTHKHKKLLHFFYQRGFRSKIEGN